MISAYCNGSPRARNIGARNIQNGEDYQPTVGDGSIPCITDVAIRALKLIAPDSDQIPLLEELKAQAEMRCAERCAARNAAVPAFSDFLGAKTVSEWAAAMGADASLTTVSRCTWALMQVAIASSRERMLQGLRYYRTDAFEVDAVHAEDHNGEPPASLVCEGGEPQRLVLGLKGANASKNGFFAEIPLDTPVLPEAAHLVPLIKGGLTQLCEGLKPGDCVFRPEVGAFGRNNLGAYFKQTFGYTCGVLRKSVEQRAYQTPKHRRQSQRASEQASERASKRRSEQASERASATE